MTVAAGLYLRAAREEGRTKVAGWTARMPVARYSSGASSVGTPW